MLARRIVSHGPSTANPPRWMMASTPLVTRTMSLSRPTSPSAKLSSGISFLIGRMSDRRMWYLPASSGRSIEPTLPAAPVRRTIFMGGPGWDVVEDGDGGRARLSIAPEHEASAADLAGTEQSDEERVDAVPMARVLGPELGGGLVLQAAIHGEPLDQNLRPLLGKIVA